MQWNPQQYEQFERERSAPFRDASQLIHVRPQLEVIDLGCGTGALTSRLAELLPNSSVLGIDTSAEMLQQAQQYVRPGVTFEQAAIEHVHGAWDVVFSHAAIQWIAEHPRLIAHLWSLVRPGGQLVVQLPSNHGHASHTLMAHLAQQEPYRSALGGWTRQVPVLSIEQYATLLWELGGTELTVFEKVYPHEFASADSIVEWVKGTALLPYVQRLPSALRDDFVAQYRELLRAQLPMQPVFYGFRRIIWAATRPAQE